MAEHIQFPLEKQIEKANRDAKRSTLQAHDLDMRTMTPHDKALLHMELAVLNLIELLDMPEQVLNTLTPKPFWFTYDQPVSADRFFDIIQSEVGAKRLKLAQARMITNKAEER